MLLLIFLKLRKTSEFGVFAVDAKPPILEFVRIVRRTSDFGVLMLLLIFSNYAKRPILEFLRWAQKPPILEFVRIVRRTSDFRVLNVITNIFKTTQNLRFWSFCGGRKTSDFHDFGVCAYSTQNLRFWSIKCYY